MQLQSSSANTDFDRGGEIRRLMRLGFDKTRGYDPLDYDKANILCDYKSK